MRIASHTQNSPLAALLAATLLLGACGKDFNAPATTATFTVTSEPATPTADGSSIVMLTAKIDSTTPAADAKVIFTTTVGTFLGGTTTVTVPADGSGTATAQLKAPAAPGTALVTAQFLGLTKALQVSFAPVVASKGVTSIDVSPSAAPADGATLVTLRFTVDTAPRPTPATVSVSTTAGTLLGGNAPLTVAINDSGFAYAKLRAPSDSTVASVTVSAGGQTKYVDVQFVPAAPDQVLLSAPGFELKAGTANQLTLTATLIRRIGTPTPGVTVTFSADTTNGTTGDFGVFSLRSGISTSSAVTTRFTTGTSPYLGPVVLRARAVRGSVLVTDSLTIWIVP